MEGFVAEPFVSNDVTVDDRDNTVIVRLEPFQECMRCVLASCDSMQIVQGCASYFTSYLAEYRLATRKAYMLQEIETVNINWLEWDPLEQSPQSDEERAPRK